MYYQVNTIVLDTLYVLIVNEFSATNIRLHEEVMHGQVVCYIVFERDPCCRDVVKCLQCTFTNSNYTKVHVLYTLLCPNKSPNVT